MMNADPSDRSAPWDPLVRIFHWSLAAFFFLAYFVEYDWPELHSHAGYTVLGLVLFRMIWGFIGTTHARFADFVVPPGAVLRYVRELLQGNIRRPQGHDPLGAVMIVVLLCCLVATVASGMTLFAMEGRGPLAWMPLAGWSDGALVGVHHFCSEFTLILIGVHVLGVLVMSLVEKRNLVGRMIGGRGRGRSRLLVPVVLLVMLHPVEAWSEPWNAATVSDMQAELALSASRPFSADEGHAVWYREVDGRSCTSCHMDSPAVRGRHEQTGKPIEPMAPSVNPERLTDRKKIDKWFLRNCKWTYGRVCTAQEKGDILSWLAGQ